MWEGIWRYLWQAVRKIFRSSGLLGITGLLIIIRADSRLAPSQWETLLQSNAISHWLGTNLESALHHYIMVLLITWRGCGGYRCPGTQLKSGRCDCNGCDLGCIIKASVWHLWTAWHLSKRPTRYHESGLIPGLRPANERPRYFVTTSLIAWMQA